MIFGGAIKLEAACLAAVFLTVLELLPGEQGRCALGTAETGLQNINEQQQGYYCQQDNPPAGNDAHKAQHKQQKVEWHKYPFGCLQAGYKCVHCFAPANFGEIWRNFQTFLEIFSGLFQKRIVFHVYFPLNCTEYDWSIFGLC